MENLPTTQQQGMVINYDDPRMVATLKATVAKDANDAEFAMFAGFCKSTGLNPFKREIWFIKASGRVQLMTGINGFFTVANSNPVFDGHESGLIDPSGGLVSGAYPKDDFIGAWAKVYRKDRRIPTEGIAMLSEYDKGQGNWPRMKRVMILKCAESVALRKAFPQELNGLYTQEEMPTDYGQKDEQTQPQAAPAPKVAPAQAAKPEPKVIPLVDTTPNHSYEWPPVKALYAGLSKQERAEAWKEAVEKYGAHIDAAADMVTTSKEHPDWEAYRIKPFDEMTDEDFEDKPEPEAVKASRKHIKKMVQEAA